MEKIKQKLIRQRRVRKKIKTSARPRLSVFRSNKYIYGQIIDDSVGKTLVSVGKKDLGKEALSNVNIDKAKALGKILAEKAQKKKIKQVVFDRGSFSYHGQIKALAEGAREGGLIF